MVLERTYIDLTGVHSQGAVNGHQRTAGGGGIQVCGECVMLTLRGIIKGWRNSELHVPDGRIGPSESAPGGVIYRTAKHSPSIRLAPLRQAN
jgi:hypothetical protein